MLRHAPMFKKKAFGFCFFFWNGQACNVRGRDLRSHCKWHVEPGYANFLVFLSRVVAAALRAMHSAVLNCENKHCRNDIQCPSTFNGQLYPRRSLTSGIPAQPEQ